MLMPRCEARHAARLPMLLLHFAHILPPLRRLLFAFAFFERHFLSPPSGDFFDDIFAMLSPFLRASL